VDVWLWEGLERVIECDENDRKEKGMGWTLDLLLNECVSMY
jgi:hypothetical protein